MTAARAPLTADTIVDEFVYAAADTKTTGVALVSGLTIARQPDRFTPLLALTNARTTTPEPATP